MRKILSKLLASVMFILALIPSGTVYAQSSPESGIVYTDQLLGFSLILPTSWSGKFSVINGAQSTTFLHTASRDTADAGTLFYILRFDGTLLPEGALGGAGGRHLAAQTELFSYILAYPSGVEFTDETEAEYQKMTADIAAILQTVKAIPVTGTANPTYSAAGKVDDNGLTDNYIYTFAKGTKDAAPGECLLMINGQFTDWPVIIRNNRALVPISAAQEAIDTYIFWDNKESIAITGTNNTRIEMTLEKKQASVNGKMIAIDAAPIVENGAVYLPIRFVCEYLGKSVGYLPAGASTQYRTDVSGQEPAKGLAYNPVVWIDDPERTAHDAPADETLTWLKAQMTQGLTSLKENIDTANRGYLKGIKSDDPTFSQIESAISNAYYIGNIGRYAMYQGPYITLVDIDAKVIYFYTTAHSLGAIWVADMSEPDTFVPMYFAD